MAPRLEKVTGGRAAPDRVVLIRKIQVARRDLAMEEESYRAMLARVTGRDSLKTMTPQEMERVLREFERLGFVGKKKVRKFRPSSDKPYVRLIFALWREMSPMLRSEGSEEALRTFIMKMAGVDAPQFLNEPQARRVIEGLKKWRDRLKKGES